MKISNRRILRTSALDLAKIGLYRLVMSEQDDLACLAGTGFTSNEPENATERDVIREKKINNDSQWLSEPEKALEKRIKYSNRATSYKAVKVYGYSGEDLFDKFNVKVDGSNFIRLKRIHKIHITANQNGIVTRLYTYFDSYSGDISTS